CTVYTLSLHDALPICSLYRRDERVQAQHGALPLAHDLLVVCVTEHRDEDPLDAHGRLDHVRRVALAVLPDELELRPGRNSVLRRSEEHTSELQSPYDL